MPKSILISGASSGIGKALSLELAHQGYQVFAGVRNLDDAEALSSQSTGPLKPVLFDITQPEMITAVCQAISDQTSGELFCLVNNAGISLSGALEFMPIEEFRQQMEVNVIGQLTLTQACLPMLRNNHGKIIFISSIAGRLVTPFTGPYAASKAALMAIADALRLELAPWNVYVTVLIVGSVKTPIWEKSWQQAIEISRREPPEASELYGKYLKRAGDFYLRAGSHGIQAQKVARIASDVVAADHPKEYILVGSDALLLELIAKLYPIRARDWIMRYQMGLLKR